VYKSRATIKITRNEQLPTFKPLNRNAKKRRIIFQKVYKSRAITQTTTKSQYSNSVLCFRAKNKSKIIPRLKRKLKATAKRIIRKFEFKG
jgi:hypothetical protein